MSIVQADFDENSIVQRVDASQVAILNRSDVEAQLDAAHKYPRSIKKFLQDAEAMATLNEEVAASCIYALPRGDGDPISGPSVRLAEICAAAWGNLQFGSRVLGAEETEVVAQGAAWDMEKNNRAAIEVRRKILNKKGKRYNADMINVTGSAGASIALRNAIFKVIPRVYVMQIYAKARAVAVGDAKTLHTRRVRLVEWLQKAGVKPDRIFARVGKTAIEDVGLDELEKLIGLANAIRSNEVSIDEAFPDPAAATASGPQASAEEKLKAAAQEQPKSESKPEPPKDPSPTATSSRATSSSDPRPPAPIPASPTPVNDASAPPSQPGTQVAKADPVALGVAARAFADQLDAAESASAVARIVARISAAARDKEITDAEHQHLEKAAQRVQAEIRASGA